MYKNTEDNIEVHISYSGKDLKNIFSQSFFRLSSHALYTLYFPRKPLARHLKCINTAFPLQQPAGVP